MRQVARKPFYATVAQLVQDQRIYPRRECRHMPKSNDINMARQAVTKQKWADYQMRQATLMMAMNLNARELQCFAVFEA